MTTTVRTIFSINATDRSHDFLVIRRGPAGISIEAQSREDEWESATAGPFTPEQLRAALDEVAPAGSYTRTDEPDDLDGGVTAALIEKEAEQRACPDLDAHWRLDEAMDRAERAERERDEWKDSAIQAMADLERAEQPRPLIPDDAMVLRALNTDMWEEHKVGPWGSLDSFRTPAVDAMRAVLTAALTVPQRPEGAEEMEALIGSWERSELLGQNLTTDDLNSLADHLAERVASVGLTPTNPEETP